MSGYGGWGKIRKTGDWGVRLEGETVEPGTVVAVRSRAGKVKTVRLGEPAWQGSGVALYALSSPDPTPDEHAAAVARAEGGEAEKVAAVEASRATDADVDVPVPEGLAYLPYQRAGIAAALRIFGDR